MSVTTPTAASVGTRLGAYALDQVVALAVIWLPIVLTGRPIFGLLVSLGYGVWFLWWLGSSGFTPGKRMLGARVVDAATGASVGFWRAFLRQLVVGVLGPVNLVQLITIRSSPRLQGWHDKVAATVVVASTTAAPAVGAQAPSSPAGLRPNGPPLPAAPVATGMVPPPPGMVLPPPSLAVAPAATPVEPPAPATPVASVVEPPPFAPPTTPAPAPVRAASVPAPADETPTAVCSVLDVVGDRTTVIKRVQSACWMLNSVTGSTRLLDGLVLVGRAPDLSLVTGASEWAVDDPGFTVSKTHALFGVEDGAVWVEDWHSTNGVVLRHDGTATEIEPHRRTPLASGDEIELGEFVLTLKEVV